MKKVVAIIAFLTTFASSASALTLPVRDRYYFVGSTIELMRIRAGIAHIAGFPAPSWTAPFDTWGVLPPPLGMGAVDCMDAFYEPGQGPYDGAEDYLGMSTYVVENGVQIGVEIPALEDLKRDADGSWPGECYGYMFHALCSDWFFGPWQCPDPPPPELDGGA